MYEKHVWSSGEVITAEKLNDMGVEMVYARVDWAGDYPTVPYANKTFDEIAEIISEKRPYVAFIVIEDDGSEYNKPRICGAHINLDYDYFDNGYEPSRVELVSTDHLDDALFLQVVTWDNGDPRWTWNGGSIEYTPYSPY